MSGTAADDSRFSRLRIFWLLAATFLVSIAGIFYELVIATSSTFLIGDSVRQFSFVIGLFLTSMGIGAWVSRYVGTARVGFIWGQMALALIGGASAPLLFLVYAYVGSTGALLLVLIIATGALSGMEIPLIVRMLNEMGAAKFRFENVLSLDYVGALVASLMFPIIIVPLLGLISSSLLFGTLNLAIAGITLLVFWDSVSRAMQVFWLAAAVVLVGGLMNTERLVSLTDTAIFEDDIIYSQTTPYQKIIVTKYLDRFRLYLNNGIQFDSLDEHRYHELLVHPAILGAARAERVLILGGGDGLAAREVLKHETVKQVDLVDLDPAVTTLFSTHATLRQLNANALNDPRVTVHNADAWTFLETRLADQKPDALYDVVIADLPDPKDYALSKLYSVEFYRLLRQSTSGSAVVVTQAGSPTFAPDAFWSVNASLSEGFSATDAETLAYHGYVPSFGDWGFALGHRGRFQAGAVESGLPGLSLRYLNPQIWGAAQSFPADTAKRPVEANRLTNHALVEYYLDGWAQWFM